MQKKILLKKTREYLQSSFPENLLPARKLRQKSPGLKARGHKTGNLKIQVIKAKKEVFNQYANSAKNLFALIDKPIKSPRKDENVTFYNPKIFLGNELSQRSILRESKNEESGLQTKRAIVGGVDKEKSSTILSQAYQQNSTAIKGNFTNSELGGKQLKIVYPTTVPLVLSYPPFLFSTNQIQYELSRRKTRSSDFKIKLKERKKLALIYGQLSKKYIKKTLKQALKLNGKKHDNFFFLLEARLDVVIFRACFFSSIKAARQWINHNKVLVNNKCINTSSYRLKPGDIISIKPKNRILLSRKIMHFLKKSFFKQNKSTPKNFVISTFLFKKLKNSLNIGNDKGWMQGYLPFVSRKIQKGVNVLGVDFAPATNTPKKVTNYKNTLNNNYPNFILDYKQFLFQVKKVLFFVLNKYSNKNKYLQITNSAVSTLSQAEKNTLILNLIQVELLEKKNLESLEGLRGFLIHLKLKKLFLKSEKKKSFSILNQNVVKPLNLEISYKNLLIIYLYPPQKITFACSIDMELISRSLV